jgi:hypothetical protein
MYLPFPRSMFTHTVSFSLGAYRIRMSQHLQSCVDNLTPRISGGRKWHFVQYYFYYAVFKRDLISHPVSCLTDEVLGQVIIALSTHDGILCFCPPPPPFFTHLILAYFTPVFLCLNPLMRFIYSGGMLFTSSFLSEDHRSSPLSATRCDKNGAIDL